MKLFIVLWIAEAVSSAVFMLAGHPITTKKSFLCKLLPCAIYVFNAAYAYSLSDRTAFGMTVLLGIVCGLIGDLFLAADPFARDKNKPKAEFAVLLLGGLFFLAGHAAYIASFLRLLLDAHAFRFLPFAAITGGMLAFFALLLKCTDIHAGKYTLPVAIYACGLCSMFALGICAALFVIKGNPVLRAILIAAPILFAYSDVSLAMKTADKKRFGSLAFHIVSLTAYFIAQMLFGMAIYLQ